MIATQKSKGIWEAEEINLTLKNLSAWSGEENSRCLAGEAGRKESALLCGEGFGKLVFQPVVKNLQGFSLSVERGRVFPMRVPSWPGAVLSLGVQLRGKEPGLPATSTILF